MKIWKYSVLFYLGGMCYSALELLWRGFTHWSMFLLGGACFVLVGRLKRLGKVLPLPLRMLLGAVIITALELGCGLLVNRQFRVWDYRRLPFNFLGQICLPFSLLWIPLSLVAMALYHFAERNLSHFLPGD